MESNVLTRYETQLVIKDEITLPFDKITDTATKYDREYWAKCANSVIEDRSKEHKIFLYLAPDGSVVGAEIIAVGSDMSVSYNILHCVRTAYLLGSQIVVSVHNHPLNKNTDSSAADIVSAKNIKGILEKYHITLADSLVITDDGSFSSTFDEIDSRNEKQFLSSSIAAPESPKSYSNKIPVFSSVLSIILKAVSALYCINLVFYLTDLVSENITIEEIIRLIVINFAIFYFVKLAASALSELNHFLKRVIEHKLT